MEIIIYAHTDNAQKDKLLKKVSQVSNLPLVMVLSFEDLFHLMRAKISGEVIIVFLISSVKEIESLDSNREYLSNTRNIIILPNGEEPLVSMALSLHPRYLSYMNHQFKDVSAVLNKMIQYDASEKARLQTLRSNNF